MKGKFLWPTLALACGLAAAGGARADTLRISMTADIRSSEPGVNRDDNSDAVVLHVVEGLVAYGEDATVRPLLAKSVKVSPDGMAYTFMLRQGVKFQNGAPFTSADVLWTWQHYMRPGSGWRCQSEFDGHGAAKVVGVEAPDPYTVVFRLDKPNGLFLVSLARTDCGDTGILQKASVNPDGSWNKPIGTGPFLFSDWVRGQYISLKKFPGYANQGGKLDGYTGSKRALVDEVRFMVIPDEATAKAALERGDIDVLEPLANSDAAVMKKEPGVTVAQAPVMGMTALLIQTKDPLLQNVKLRQAIAHALDYAQIAAAASDGLDQPNNSVMPRSSPYYGSVQKQGWDYDPALSKRLLAEAGYHGQPLTILANKNYPETYNAAVVIQAMLQAAGINATLSVMEWGTQLDRYVTGKYQMMSFPYSARLDPALNYDMLTGDKARQPRKLWDDPDAIHQVQQAQIETDRAKRQAIFDQLHKEFLAEVPSIPLFNGLDIAAYRNDIKGYKPWVMKKPRAWEVEKTGN